MVEELSSCKQNLIIKFRAQELCKSHFFKPNAFFKIWRSNEDNSFTIVHKSTVIKSSKKPSWPELNLKVKNLCNGDYDRNIKIEFFNHKKSVLINHREIGCVYTSLNQLLNLEKEGNTYEVCVDFCLFLLVCFFFETFANVGNLISLEISKLNAIFCSDHKCESFSIKF